MRYGPYRGYIFIQQIQVLNILNTLYTLRFFSSKGSLFLNSNVFGSCFIHVYIQNGQHFLNKMFTKLNQKV